VKTIKFILALLFIFSFFILPFAQNLFAAEIEELEVIKVTSSRDTLTTKNFPGSLTIFNEQEIETKQHQTVEDLLRGELGLDVVQSGGQGQQTSIFMRGQGSKSTLVVIDGVRVNSNTAGLYDFGDLTLDNIEKIEVLRGPQSIQWGGDAVGGTINIVTKKGKGAPKHSLSFEGGSYNTTKQSIRSSGSINKFDYSLSASLLKTSGISALNKASGGIEEDRYTNKTFISKIGYEINDDSQIELSTRYTKSHDELDSVNGQGSGTDNRNSNTIDDFYLSAVFKTKFSDWWSFKINPNMNFQEAATIDTSENDHFINRQYTFYLENNMKVHPYFSVLWGGEYERQEGTADSLFSDFVSAYQKFTDNNAYFLQGIYDYNNILTLTGGFRHDINSIFGEVTTYKFEAGRNFLKTNTQLHTAYSKGFRAPTFNDYNSNPNLKSEETQSFEVGVRQGLMNDKITVGITYFKSLTTNFIQSHPSTFVTTNFGKFYSQGIETEVDLELPYNLALSIRHTWNDHYLDEKSKSDHNQPGTRRPKQKLIANLTHRWNNKLESLAGIFARGFARGFNATNSTEGFVTVRTAFSYQYSKKIKLTLRAENLLDQDYTEVGGFSVAGRNVYAGFVYNFN
tara:strand:- start:12725 stop:14596 length:1872 start_codon:yes stop_codon:yes gene_type:complete